VYFFWVLLLGLGQFKGVEFSNQCNKNILLEGESGKKAWKAMHPESTFPTLPSASTITGG